MTLSFTLERFLVFREAFKKDGEPENLGERSYEVNTPPRYPHTHISDTPFPTTLSHI